MNCMYHASVVCLYKWLLWIMAAVQDSGDKQIKTTVEKMHFTDCQNLHSCSVYLGRQTPNIILSWGGAHVTCSPRLHIQSSSPPLWAQHDNHNKRTRRVSKLVFLTGFSSLSQGLQDEDIKNSKQCSKCWNKQSTFCLSVRLPRHRLPDQRYYNGKIF